MKMSQQKAGAFLVSELTWVLTTLFLSSCVLSSFGEGIQLGTNVTARFASVEAGREILTRRDEFIAALTPLDRRARMRTDLDVSEKDYMSFLNHCVRAWTPEETNRLAGVFLAIRDKLVRWELPFPATILLVKTSGEEEFNNCYTRQNAIIFPAAEVAGRPSALNYIILHELFHVLTRQNPELRKAVYGSIGFRPINEIDLPEELLRRKITNPDGVHNGWMINLTNQNEALQAVPILLAKGNTFNPNEGGANPYDYFRLLVVEPGDAGWVAHLVGGHPRLLRPTEVTGWFEQIGRNTRYTIHPDEILADNFVHLINGNTNLPTPLIVYEFGNALTRRAPKK
jgi:hypothetical protein